MLVLPHHSQHWKGRHCLLKVPLVLLNVLRLLRETRKWDHNCISVPQLLGSKGTPVSTWRGGTVLCPWHGHSRERFLNLLTCPAYVCIRTRQVTPSFSVLRLQGKPTDCLTYGHLKLGQIISVFYGRRVKTLTCLYIWLHLWTKHVSLAKSAGSDRQGQPQPWSQCTWLRCCLGEGVKYPDCRLTVTMWAVL